MYTIKNVRLAVELLNPYNDAGRTGSRYCAGGYIWQIYGIDGRPLLSGPGFPSPAPPVFDGQGMPEVFETPLGGDDGPVGSEVCVIGVGTVEKTSGVMPFHPRNNPNVIKPCRWAVSLNRHYVIMETEQRHKEKSICLRREVRVGGGRVESISTVANAGAVDVNLRWFPHPFFPPNGNLACGKIIPSASMPDNAGYETDAGGMIRMKPDYNWKKGLFQVLDVPPEKLTFTVPHPVAGQVTFETDYNAARCALWANDRTFSFEPFMACTVKPGEKVTWSAALSVEK